MTDYQSIVDSIKRILCADADPKLHALAALEASYVAAIQEVNLRLQNCESLLSKGHRAEALQICEIEPRLIDVVGILDFAEREQWTDYVKQFGLPEHPEVLFEVAAELNEAYTAEKPLAGLMRLHRLYALGRVPLSHRIDVLRKISAADQGNPIWNDDLRTFEKARHNELRDEIAIALKQNDLGSIVALEKELCAATWLAPPPKSAVEKVTQAQTRMRAEQARIEIEDVEKELTAAYSSLEPEKARVLRNRWNKLLTLADLSADAPIIDLVAPALEWLAIEDRRAEEQAQYDASIAGLERALDNDQPQLELERLYRLATQHARELPPALERRLAERLRSLEERDRRRSRLQIVAVMCGVLLLAGLTATGIIFQMRSRELDEYVLNLEKLLGDEKLAEAEIYHADMERAAPHVASTPQVQKLRGDLQNALSRETGRKAQLQQALEAAKAAGVDDPNWESFSVADDDLKRARGLAKPGEEQAEVKRLERRIREKHTAMQTAVDSDFIEKLSAFKESVAQLNSDDLEGNTLLQQDAIALQQRPRVTPEIRVQVDPLLAKLRAMELAVLGAKNEAAAMLQIQKAVGNPVAYAASLESYIKTFPGTKRSNDFDSVMTKELESLQGVEAWNVFRRRWSALDFAKIGPPDAAALNMEATSIISQHGNHPAASNLEPFIGFLRFIGNRVDMGGASTAAKLNEPLNNPTVAGLFVVQTRDGKRYYARAKPKPATGGWNVSYLKAFDFSKKGQKLIPDSEIANPIRDGGIDWVAPQSAFSDMALSHLDSLNAAKWEETFGKLIVSLYEDGSMEPLLKLQLMSIVIEAAGEGSQYMATAFAKHITLINTAQFDPALNWIDPDDSEAINARIKAEQLLKRMENPRTVVARGAKVVSDLKQLLNKTEYQWVASLQRDRDGQWTCTPTTRTRGWENGVGDLLMIEVPSDGMPSRFVKIGELKGKKLLLGSTTPAGLLEGRPVLWKNTR